MRLETATSAKRAPEGYAYIFPKRDHVNVGIGYVLSHYRRRDRRARRTSCNAGFVARLRDRGVVDGDSVQQNFTPFLIPVGGTAARPGRGRVLLAGDAGGFVNGVTAEGIYYAMVSGELAARAILETGHGVKRSGQALSPRVRLRNWRRVARFRADSALPVRGPPQNCPGYLRRES